MSHVVDGGEGEVVTRLHVSHDLLSCLRNLVEIWTPSIGNIPSLVCDPLLSALSGHDSVVSAGEKQSSISSGSQTIVEID